MKISVIVPIYNAEKYLKECIDSILMQEYKDMEILLVNDGSTDDSLEICKGYEQIDPRIRIINQENTGQSGARNKGMEYAEGDYFCFVDADDRLTKNAIKKLAKAALKGNYDIAAGGYYRFEKTASKEKTAVLFQEGVISRVGTKEEKTRYHKYKTTSGAGYVWGKLYKSEFLKNNHLLFDDIKKVFMEDTLFNTKVFTYLPKYYVIKEPVYCYYVYESSFSHRKQEKVSIRYIHMMNELEKFLEERNRVEENMDLLAAVGARTFCWSIVKNIPYTGLSFQKIYKEITYFAKADYMKKLVRNKKAYITLKFLESPLERLFYAFCFLMLRLHMGVVLAFIVTITYPLQRKYMNSHLK